MSYGKGVAEGGRGYFILLRMSEREACCVATALSVLRPCRIHRKVYFPDYKMYLSKLANVFVHIFKCICLNLKCICRLATAPSVARPCAIPSKVRNFTLRLNRRRKCWVDKLHYKRGLQQQLSLTSTNLICIYEIYFAIKTNTYIYLNK